MSNEYNTHEQSSAFTNANANFDPRSPVRNFHSAENRVLSFDPSSYVNASSISLLMMQTVGLTRTPMQIEEGADVNLIDPRSPRRHRTPLKSILESSYRRAPQVRGQLTYHEEEEHIITIPDHALTSTQSTEDTEVLFLDMSHHQDQVVEGLPVVNGPTQNESVSITNTYTVDSTPSVSDVASIPYSNEFQAIEAKESFSQLLLDAKPRGSVSLKGFQGKQQRRPTLESKAIISQEAENSSFGARSPSITEKSTRTASVSTPRRVLGQISTNSPLLV